MTIHWQWKFFSELDKNALYDILALRQHVFMLEQNSLYLDADGADKDAWHLLGSNSEGRLLVYLRVIPAAAPEEQTLIGRFVVSEEARGKGLGRLAMEECLRWIDDYFPAAPVKIGAQQYLKDFYRRLGFSAIGEPYDDAGVPHIDMLKPAAIDMGSP